MSSMVRSISEVKFSDWAAWLSADHSGMCDDGLKRCFVVVNLHTCHMILLVCRFSFVLEVPQALPALFLVWQMTATSLTLKV